MYLVFHKMYYPKNEVLHDKSVPLKFSLPISQKSNVSNFGVIEYLDAVEIIFDQSQSLKGSIQSYVKPLKDT